MQPASPSVQILPADKSASRQQGQSLVMKLDLWDLKPVFKVGSGILAPTYKISNQRRSEEGQKEKASEI